MTPDDIKAIRAAHGLGPAKFGALFGVSRQAIWAWETGKNPPPLLAARELARLARQKGVRLSTDPSPEPPPPPPCKGCMGKGCVCCGQPATTHLWTISPDDDPLTILSAIQSEAKRLSHEYRLRDGQPEMASILQKAYDTIQDAQGWLDVVEDGFADDLRARYREEGRP